MATEPGSTDTCQVVSRTCPGLVSPKEMVYCLSVRLTRIASSSCASLVHAAGSTRVASLFTRLPLASAIRTRFLV